MNMNGSNLQTKSNIQIPNGDTEKIDEQNKKILGKNASMTYIENGQWWVTLNLLYFIFQYFRQHKSGRRSIHIKKLLNKQQFAVHSWLLNGNLLQANESKKKWFLSVCILVISIWNALWMSSSYFVFTFRENSNKSSLAFGQHNLAYNVLAPRGGYRWLNRFLLHNYL